MTDATMIIPTRHRAHFLEATIRSLQAAAAEAGRGTKDGVRILVVDDAPDNDETQDLAKWLGVDYARVEEHDGRKDPGAAIKLGTALVDTEFQALFGDDDVTLIRHFRTAFEHLASGDWDVVSNSFHVVDDQLRVTNTVRLMPTGLADLVQGRTALNDGSFVRHDLIKDFDFDVSLEAHMLPPMWAKLMLDDARFTIVDEPTWLYRRHDTNLSMSALSERDLGLRRRSNEKVRAMVLERLGHLPGDASAPTEGGTEESIGDPAPAAATSASGTPALEVSVPTPDPHAGAASAGGSPSVGAPVPTTPGSSAGPASPSAPPAAGASAPTTPSPSAAAGNWRPARALRYRVLNKTARVLRRLSDKAVEASRRS